MENLNILIIEGGSRPQRKSKFAAEFVKKVGESIDGIEVTLVGPNDFDINDDGNESDEKYNELVQKADAFFIITPEYNHSFPGGLKRLLDTNLKNYIHKPVALAGVSAGPWGGTRAIEHLTPVVRELGMAVTFNDLHFPGVGKVFDKNGELQDEKFTKRTQEAYTELIWMAKTLKWGRENVESKHHQD